MEKKIVKNNLIKAKMKNILFEIWRKYLDEIWIIKKDIQVFQKK